MKILSFDTSTKAASVALVVDEVLVGEIMINDRRTHSQKLMPILESLCSLADISMSEIDLLAVCIGPGAFTGLRIAMATVKAISHVRDIPVVAVDSMEMLAYNLYDSDKTVIPVLDAQGKQVYTAFYRKDERGCLKREGNIEVMDIDSLLKKASECKNPIILGEGIYKYMDSIKDFGNIETAQPAVNISKASSAAFIALHKYENGVDIHNCYDILPMYIRKSQAEMQYEEKQRKLNEAKND